MDMEPPSTLDCVPKCGKKSIDFLAPKISQVIWNNPQINLEQLPSLQIPIDLEPPCTSEMVSTTPHVHRNHRRRPSGTSEWRPDNLKYIGILSNMPKVHRNWTPQAQKYIGNSGFKSTSDFSNSNQKYIGILNFPPQVHRNSQLPTPSTSEI